MTLILVNPCCEDRCRFRSDNNLSIHIILADIDTDMGAIGIQNQCPYFCPNPIYNHIWLNMNMDEVPGSDDLYPFKSLAAEKASF